MISAIKTVLKKSRLFKMLRPAFVLAWQLKGRPVPPPHFVKQQVVADYAKRFGIAILVETGTYYGDMIDAVKDDFKKIYSIELDDALFRRAQARYAAYPHIKIISGDSAKKMPEVLAELKEPTLFWLDGHYSGPGTAQGDLETPLLQELKLILAHPIKHHVILIDDAREFGHGDYPAAAALAQLVASQAEYAMDIKDDSARIYNKNTRYAGLQ